VSDIFSIVHRIGKEQDAAKFFEDFQLGKARAKSDDSKHRADVEVPQRHTQKRHTRFMGTSLSKMEGATVFRTLKQCHETDGPASAMLSIHHCCLAQNLR
jgi:hypothetical protein